MARRIESFFLEGPAGRLEAVLEEPESGPPREAALVCHPHPLHGGTLHNKVVHRLARGLRRTGCVTLRFNFRGVNLSAGAHDHGVGEVDDARAAISFLKHRYPALPLTVAGFSFGSRVALQCHQGARRVLLAGFPTVNQQFSILDRCPLPRIFLHSTNDALGPRPEMEALFQRLWGPKQLHWIEAADHFFAGALDAFESVVMSLDQPPA
ncbi:MAG: alpha/beta hydrolase [Acidobacteria bacterium]|nr:alpha/beta hydrolase [Acidobacteriota bacterium]